MSDYKPASWLVSAGRPETPGAPMNVPPSTASNFDLGGSRVYTRDSGTPGWEALEQLVGGLEGGEAVQQPRSRGHQPVQVGRRHQGADADTAVAGPYHGNGNFDALVGFDQQFDRAALNEKELFVAIVGGLIALVVIIKFWRYVLGLGVLGLIGGAVLCTLGKVDCPISLPWLQQGGTRSR